MWFINYWKIVIQRNQENIFLYDDVRDQETLLTRFARTVKSLTWDTPW